MMTVDEIMLAFEKAVERPINTGLHDIDGFLHLIKLGWKPNKDIFSSAEHDQVWLNVDMEWFASVATVDDINYLYDCGIWYDSGYVCLGMSV